MTTYTTLAAVKEHYTIEATGNEHRPYRVFGPRSAEYTLWRNVKNPDMLFATNKGKPIKMPKVKARWIKE